MNTDIFKKGLAILSKNSPTILTTLGVSGLVGTVILAVKATPQACELIQIAEVEKDDPDGLTTLETIKVAWKPYIPATITGAATIGCIVGANTVNSRRGAAITSAYILADKALDEYKAKVIETIGEKKAARIEDEIAQDRIDANPVNEQTIIFAGGDVLCYDVFSGRYFKSTVEKLKRVENEVNKDLLLDLWISLNDVYYKIGLDPLPVGEHLGWSIDSFDLINFRYSTCLSQNDEPCVSIDFDVEPKYQR